MVKLITWKDEYSVGVAELDRQHRGLIEMIGELHEAMMEGRGGDVMGDILERLVEYTKVHFGAEEAYFAEFDYPGTAMHIAEHRKLIAEVDRYIGDFREKKTILSVELLVFLTDWLSNHIIASDKLYGPYLNAKGLK